MKKLTFFLALGLMMSLGVQTLKAEPNIYASYSSNKLTLYYGEQKNSGDVTNWSTFKSYVISVVLDESMKDARPTSTKEWFLNFTELEHINHLDYLNTSEVTDMSSMFYGCKKLKTLDVSHFDTKNVEYMSYMFWGCSTLTTLDVSHFDTRNVKNMTSMFAACQALTSLNVCGFDISNVTAMGGMFTYCTALKTIYCDNNWSTIVSKLVYTKNMFEETPALEGGKGTKYASTNPMDITYARPDESGNPGYFTTFADFPEEIYAVLSMDQKTMTLYFDRKREARSGVTDWSIYRSYTESFSETGYKVTSIILDESMQNARPTSTASWFKYFSHVTGFQHLEYLNTSDVTDMSLMFWGGYSLTALDVTGFDTKNVTDMNSMFVDCQKLTSLDVSHFNTEKVKFIGAMFGGCRALTSLDVSNFDTGNVERMGWMFNECKALTSLDIRNFNVDKVEWMDKMFYECTALKTIYCNEDWSGKKVTASDSYDMFTNCVALTGGNGTKYSDYNTNNIAYANPDKTGKPGYFTKKGLDPLELYAVQSTDKKTMTLYYDRKREANGGVTDWSGFKSTVTTIVLDESMKDARPTSTKYWFYMFSKLTEIQHLDYLNTSEVKDMLMMFFGCGALTELDLSHFDTKNVEDMSYMISSCAALTSLDLKSFDTKNVKKMDCMFALNTNLTELNLSSFNTENVTGMSAMFWGCQALTSLDVTNFDIKKVTNMNSMFNYCTALTTIYCNEDWSKSTALTDSDIMFADCPALVGGNGTKYNDAYPKDVTYAHPDEAGNPGYFTKKTTTAIDEINASGKFGGSRKLLRDGQLFIEQNGHTYTLTGQEVK